MNTIGLFFKQIDKKIVSSTKNFIRSIKSEKIRILVTAEQSKYIGKIAESTSPENFGKLSKFIISLGGDGTMLRASRTVAQYGVPIFGIHLGGLGFLTEVEMPQALASLKQILAGKYFIDERMMLEGRVIRKGKEIDKILALNDIVISKSGIARVIKFEAQTDKGIIASYAADGLIVSTPTGSTGHSLSAGGPLVSPNATAIIISAICPHTLTHRPIVLTSPDNEQRKPIEVQVHLANTPQGQEVMLTADGQCGIALKQDDIIEIKESQLKTKFLRLKPYNFFEILHKKLRWG